MRSVDVRAIRENVVERRARKQAALRPRMALADRVVVGVEEHPEGGVESAIAAQSRSSTKVSKNQVVCARCHFTGLASGIDCSAQSSADSGAASARPVCRTAR